jgi:hypothetical protein
MFECFEFAVLTSAEKMFIHSLELQKVTYLVGRVITQVAIGRR